MPESQRAMVAAEIANLENGEAGRGEERSANLQSKVSRKQAAEMLNVSERSVNSRIAAVLVQYQPFLM